MKWCTILLIFIGNSIQVYGQLSENNFSLQRVIDSTNLGAYPLLFLKKDSTVEAVCPCFAYDIQSGSWIKTNDSTYFISLTDTAKEKLYRIVAIDSTPTKTFTTLYFKNSKGKRIDTIHLKLNRQNTIYHSNTEGKILLLRPYNSYRYNIITEAHPNDTIYAILQKFSPKMQYTITLTEPKRVHTFHYYLRKEKGLWAYYDVKSNERIAWFTEDMHDPYEDK